MTCLYIICSGNIRVTWWKQSEKNFTAVSLQHSTPGVFASLDYKLQISLQPSSPWVLASVDAIQIQIQFIIQFQIQFALQLTWSICVHWCGFGADWEPLNPQNQPPWWGRHFWGFLEVTFLDIFKIYLCSIFFYLFTYTNTWGVRTSKSLLMFFLIYF